MKNIIVNLLIGAIIGALAGGCHWYKNHQEVKVVEKPIVIIMEEPEQKPEEIHQYSYPETEVDIEEEMYYDSLEYLACLVEAEAGNQDEYGKRLVCDTVLNRFDEGDYISMCEVINADNQYAVVDSGVIYDTIPSEETYRIVAEELDNRTSYEVRYFRTGSYHEFGTPLYKVGDHYFSR